MANRPNATEAQGGEPCALLRALRESHSALLRDMAEMDRLAAGSLPDTDELQRARGRIHAASFGHQIACERALQWLIQLSGRDDDVAVLLALQGAAHDMIMHIEAHVERWTASSASADWSGYVAASRALRWRLRSCINAEQRRLYPMLEEACSAVAG